MGLLVKHIQDHPGGRKSFRRQYPLNLRPFLRETQLRVSLGHPDSPGFHSRYDEAAANGRLMLRSLRGSKPEPLTHSRPS